MNSEIEKFPKPETTPLPPKTPSASKGYLELRLRIYYGWLISLSAIALVVYFFLFISTAFQMQHYETYGAKVDAQKEWEDTGCVAILQEQSKSSDLEDWEIKQRWKHLLLLDPGLQGLNNQAILDEPFCLGASIRVFAKSPSPVPWRYDIVDTKTKTIIISIVKGN